MKTLVTLAAFFTLQALHAAQGPVYTSLQIAEAQAQAGEHALAFDNGSRGGVAAVEGREGAKAAALELQPAPAATLGARTVPKPGRDESGRDWTGILGGTLLATVGAVGLAFPPLLAGVAVMGSVLAGYLGLDEWRAGRFNSGSKILVGAVALAGVAAACFTPIGAVLVGAAAIAAGVAMILGGMRTTG